MSQHFDLIVIGSGPARRRAAVQAAKLKKSVLVVERGRPVDLSNGPLAMRPEVISRPFLVHLGRST
jgi:succinate dehydrogenase/fumarate reductase flavoprotein subunit